MRKVSKLNSECLCEGGIMKAVAKSYEHLDLLFKTFKCEASTQVWNATASDNLLPAEPKLRFTFALWVVVMMVCCFDRDG